MAAKRKLPVLLVHGYGGRDDSLIQYWGDLPDELASLGYEVHLAGQDGWAEIRSNAKQIAERLHDLKLKTNHESFQLLAHSKGGLDCRYMLHHFAPVRPMVHSLVTFGTPHRGTALVRPGNRVTKPLRHVFHSVVDFWADTISGDDAPRSKAAVLSMHPDNMEQFNQKIQEVDGVFYKSIASVMEGPTADADLFASNLLLQRLEGPNDGLVSVHSACYFPDSEVWYSADGKGVSHHDLCGFHKRALMIKSDRRGDETYSLLELFDRVLQEMEALKN